jgi:hypothetical protein
MRGPVSARALMLARRHAPELARRAERVGMASEQLPKRVWAPVREQAADSFWLLLITSMSVTVLVTRFYLEMTGYPQIGDSTFHIAHVLWGGLLLFVAVALPLSLVNRYALWAASVLGGIGGGLFIDEVGKFITQGNDYFFPLAVPIIYSFILICVWLYYHILRHQPRDTRTLLYHSLEDLKQVLDNDLDPFEHRELVTELRQIVAQAQDPQELRLAEALLSYAQSREVRLAIQPNVLKRLLDSLRRTLAGWPPRLFLRVVLLTGFGLIGVQAAGKLVTLVAAHREGSVTGMLADFVVVSGKAQYTVNHPTLLLVTTMSVIGIGVLALIATVLLAVRRDRLGLRIGVLGLMIALSIVNLFTFYFSQLAAVVDAVVQVILLGVASLYRWRFLSPASTVAAIRRERPDGAGAIG